MFDTPIDFIKGSVALVFTAGLITIAGYLYTSGQKMSTTAADTLNVTAKSIEDSEYTKFLNTKVAGSDVLSFVRKHAGDLGIGIDTKTTTGSKYKEFLTVDDLNRFTNVPSNTDFYVNPVAEFTAQIERNANDAITKIVFTQTKPTNNTGDTDTIISADPSMDVDSDTIKQRLDVLEANIESVLAKLSNGSLASKDDINDLLTEIAKLKSDLGTNTNKTEEIREYLQSVNKQVDALHKAYLGISKDVQTMLTYFSSLSNGDANLQKQITDLQESVDKLPSIIASNATDVSALYSDMGVMLDQLTAMQTSLSDVLKRTIEISKKLGVTEYTEELKGMSDSVEESTSVVKALKSGLEVLQ